MNAVTRVDYDSFTRIVTHINLVKAVSMVTRVPFLPKRGTIQYKQAPPESTALSIHTLLVLVEYQQHEKKLESLTDNIFIPHQMIPNYSEQG